MSKKLMWLLGLIIPIILLGFGCNKVSSVNHSLTNSEKVSSSSPTPIIIVKDQLIEHDQVLIDRTITLANTWVIIQLLENGKPGKVIGSNLVSGGENSLFSVHIANNSLTPELVASLHTQHNGDTFNSTKDSILTDSIGQPLMVKFKVLNIKK